MKFNKLIRDKIPQLIFKSGKTPITHIATKKEYWQKLKHKLQEEVDEFFASESSEELVDILEVIYAICRFKKIPKKSLESFRLKKTKQRGGFKRKIILDKVK